MPHRPRRAIQPARPLSRPRAGLLGCTSNLAFALVWLLGSGCAAPRPAIEFTQPFAPPSQKSLLLDPRSVSIAEIEGRGCVLVALPLPGAKDGPTAYRLFVSAPSLIGEHPVTATPDGARGFLIQSIGALAGKSPIASGMVRFSTPWLSKGGTRFEFDLRCEDDATIKGATFANSDAAAIRRFIQEYSGDVAALRTDSTPTSNPTSETQLRVPPPSSAPAQPLDQ